MHGAMRSMSSSTRHASSTGTFDPEPVLDLHLPSRRRSSAPRSSSVSTSAGRRCPCSRTSTTAWRSMSTRAPTSPRARAPQARAPRPSSTGLPRAPVVGRDRQPRTIACAAGEAAIRLRRRRAAGRRARCTPRLPRHTVRPLRARPAGCARCPRRHRRARTTTTPGSAACATAPPRWPTTSTTGRSSVAMAASSAQRHQRPAAATRAAAWACVRRDARRAPPPGRRRRRRLKRRLRARGARALARGARGTRAWR